MTSSSEFEEFTGKDKSLEWRMQQSSKPNKLKQKNTPTYLAVEIQNVKEKEIN